MLATGYDNMRTSARKILGDRVADRCKDVWDLDSEGEINAVSCQIRLSVLGIKLNSNIRCGDQAAIQVSGSWAEV